MDFDAILIATLASLFLANFVQGFTGFGVGIVGVAGLTLVGDIFEATILVSLAGMITVTSVFGRLWRHTSWRHVWPVMVGMIVTIPVGLALLKTFAPTHPVVVRRVLGGVIIAFSLWSLWSAPPKPRDLGWRIGLAAGCVGGVLGGAFTMAGPPLVAYVYSLPVSRDTMKSSVNACFVFIGVYRLALLVMAGDITRPILVTFAYCIPAAVLGVVTGMVLARGVGTDRFRRIAWVVFALLGLLLIVR